MDLNHESFQISFDAGAIYVLEWTEEMHLLEDAEAEWRVTKCEDNKFDYVAAFEHLQETRVGFLTPRFPTVAYAFVPACA